MFFPKFPFNIPIQYHGNNKEMKKNDMLEIDISKNSSQKNEGVLRGAFQGFGRRSKKTPRRPAGSDHVTHTDRLLTSLPSL